MREVWLEVNRVSLQTLSLFVHFASLFKTRDFILVPLFILHARNDHMYLKPIQNIMELNSFGKKS